MNFMAIGRLARDVDHCIVDDVILSDICYTCTGRERSSILFQHTSQWGAVSVIRISLLWGSWGLVCYFEM